MNLILFISARFPMLYPQPQTAEVWQPSTSMIEQIIGWARQAGYIALRHFRNVSPQLKSDWSFITQADREIEQFLADRLQTTFPDHGLTSEEEKRGQIDPAKPIWVLD